LPGIATENGVSLPSIRQRMRRRVFTLLSTAESGDRASRMVDVFLAVLIVANVLAAIFQTVESLYQAWHVWFDAFEIASVAVFTAEYALRIWSCTTDPRYRSPIGGRLRFALTPLLLIDLLAIAPFYLSSVITLDLRMLRAVRLVRLLRVLKIARYSESLQVLGRVLVAKRQELLVTLVPVGVLLVIASTLMYYTERDAQPDQFSSIPAAMWWGVATLTTVGYGDVFPVTAAGKVIAAFIALLGIGLFALPAGILGSGFVEELQRKRQPPEQCPHCGRSLLVPPVRHSGDEQQ
jgi:voltage-gated potassium channel